MRPISGYQDVQRHLLNSVLATEGQVRVLRFLSEAGVAASAAQVSESTGVSIPGISKTLRALVSAGLVRREGRGRSSLYSFREDGPLATSLTTLFRLERERYEELLQDLQDAFRATRPSPTSAWIQRSPRSLTEPLRLAFLHTPAQSGPYLREYRRIIAPVEAAFDLVIEVAGYSPADISRTPPAFERLIWGVPPEFAADRDSIERQDVAYSGTTGSARALRLAAMVDEDPALISRARRWIERLLDEDQGLSENDLQEWALLLDTYPKHRLVQFLRSAAPRADRLRRSSPFLAVLDPDQRAELETVQ